MKKFFIAFLLILLVIPLVSAYVNVEVTEYSPYIYFGTFGAGTDVPITILCSNSTSPCDYCNITTIRYPNGTIIDSDLVMTPHLTDFNYTLSSLYTGDIGTYSLTGFCGDNEEIGTWWNNFEITKSGNDYTLYDFLPMIIALLGIITLLLGLAYLLTENHGLLSAVFAGLGFYLFVPLLSITNLAFTNRFTETGITGMVGTITTILTWLDYALIVYICVYIMVKTISGYNQDKKEKIEGLR